MGFSARVPSGMATVPGAVVDHLQFHRIERLG